jgi:hypothetical protein
MNKITFPSWSGKVATDVLWPLIVLAGFAFFVSLVPLPPNDFWWHLKIGEVIFSTGDIPTTNMFSWAIDSEAGFVYGAWLGELMLYLAYRAGRLELITFLRTFLIVLTFWLVAVETKRRSGSWRIGALAIALVSAMTLNNLTIRPQIWSWLPFMVFSLLLNKYTAREVKPMWLLACPLAMVFWVNAHGAYILGGVLVGITFVGEALRTLFKMPGALTWREVGWILGIGALTGLAMLVNPQGLGTVNYVKDLMTDQPSQQLIIEWQSPSPEGIANLTFYISILGLLFAAGASSYKLKPTELLLAGSFLWLAWTGMRYIVWYGIVVMPILMTLLVNLPLKMPKLYPQRNLLNTVLVVVLFLPTLLVQPWFVESFPLPERYWKQVQRGSLAGPLVDWDNPVEAAEYLRANPGGNLFNEMGYGSYLIWAIPEQKVFIDPRVELYPFEMWEDYIRITRGADYNNLLAKYNADRILLHKELQPELARLLTSDESWSLEYEDQRAQVWLKTQLP